jgi:hypothetical protein
MRRTHGMCQELLATHGVASAQALSELAHDRGQSIAPERAIVHAKLHWGFEWLHEARRVFWLGDPDPSNNPILEAVAKAVSIARRPLELNELLACWARASPNPARAANGQTGSAIVPEVLAALIDAAPWIRQTSAGYVGLTRLDPAAHLDATELRILELLRARGGATAICSVADALGARGAEERSRISRALASSPAFVKIGRAIVGLPGWQLSTGLALVAARRPNQRKPSEALSQTAAEGASGAIALPAADHALPALAVHDQAPNPSESLQRAMGTLDGIELACVMNRRRMRRRLFECQPPINAALPDGVYACVQIGANVSTVRLSAHRMIVRGVIGRLLAANRLIEGDTVRIQLNVSTGEASLTVDRTTEPKAQFQPLKDLAA